MIQKPPVCENFNTEVKMEVSQLHDISNEHRSPQQTKHFNELPIPVSVEGLALQFRLRKNVPQDGK